MKLTKILIVTLSLVVVLAVIGWFLRNTLIQRISGSILADYDIELVDVSLDALATEDAKIGYLELVHAKGTTVTIEGLTLPIRSPADGMRNYAAEKVSIITATRAEGEPFEMARLIDQILSLTENLAGSEIRVDEFSVSPYPVVHNLHWSITQSGQSLRATVESVELAIDSLRVDAREHDISFSVPGTTAGTNGHKISGHLRRNNSGIALAGASSIELPAWEPLTKLAGIIPETIAIESGNALLEFEAGIPYDTRESPSVLAKLTPTSALRIGHTNASALKTAILVRSASAITINATFPVVDWRLSEDDASLLLSYEDWQNIPLSISDLSCESGNVCRMSANLSMTDADLPFGTVQQLDVTWLQDVSFPVAGPRLDLRQGGRLTASGIKTTDARVADLEATLVSAGSLAVLDAGWQFDADSVDANISSLSSSDTITISAPLFLETVRVADLGQIPTARFDVFAPSIQTEWNSQDIVLPGLRGSVSRQDDEVEFNLATIDLYRDGTIEGRYELDAGSGEIAIADTAISFSDRKLSSRVLRSSFDWDLIAGVAAIDGRAAWVQTDAETGLAGQVRVDVSDVAGFYADTVFTGLSTVVEAEYDNENGFAVDPSSISAALVDLGLPVENITADYALTSDLLGADVTKLQMTAFDGVISADPFSFRTDRDSNTVVLRAESMDIREILALKEFEAIEVSGRIGAELPITMSKDGVTIAAGSLTGEAPGGVIRYTSGQATDDQDTSSIGLVKEALSHFEYDTLTSELNYNREGDLKLEMQLKGRNPDMEGSRPVILNLNVENNVPQMLKSLQAARAVEELLERRLAE